MLEWWTNRSRPPSSGVMKPKPFSSLNHLTVPLGMWSDPPCFKCCYGGCPPGACTCVLTPPYKPDGLTSWEGTGHGRSDVTRARDEAAVARDHAEDLALLRPGWTARECQR